MAQQTAPTPRLVPRADLVNVLEYEAQAKLVLDAATFARVADSDDRSGFDRITLRPRLLVPTRGLDLGLTLFGQTLHSPILVGPIDGREIGRAGAAVEIARGAQAAFATVIATTVPQAPAGSGSDVATPPWFQAFAADPSATEAVQRAVAAGCPVVCLTVGAAPSARGIAGVTVGANDWRTVQATVKAANVPVVVKGITTPAAAKQALQQGASGIVYSNYGDRFGQRGAASIVNLAAVVDAVGSAAPVLMDGGLRRGTDIVKALAFGASAVLVARPIVWALVAYGADGVQGVLEMLQTETARYMAMCGRPSLTALDRSTVRVHTR
jgi:isopentenyl diphosphate isomerase/L-lactate dehydrogenase-like FMN-dependent dehydrogenase